MNSRIERARYENGSLKEVIIQLRFPTILSINANQPVDFQERIKEKYPFFFEQQEKQNDIVFNPAVQEASVKKVGENKNYSFISSDRNRKINLTPSFIAFSTVDYYQWEFFKGDFEPILRAFEDVYNPPFYSRVGLRYINAFSRNELGANDKKWTELIQPHILGMIIPENENGVKSYVSEIVYSTKVESVFSRNHVELVHVNNNKELSLLLDSDYFTQGLVVEKECISDYMERLHIASHHFIDNAITDTLYYLMKPVSLEHE